MSLTLDKRWLALIVLCLGDLMIVLDMTVVNVALPSIGHDLGFVDTSLVWVINAYMLAFSGFLLLGGRLGDLFGDRKVFLWGIGLFTFASLLCGWAASQHMLIIARIIQGLGGAVFSAVALALIVNLFTAPADRAKALGLFGFVSAGGGAIGVLVGGLITGIFNWHWIFLINIPIGLAVFAACFYLLPAGEKKGHVRLDIAGAFTITLSLMLATYAIIDGNSAGWLSAQTLGLAAASIVSLIAFLRIESRHAFPLVPLSVFKERNVVVVSIIGIFWSVAMFAWFFLCALYLQLVLGYTPLQVGLTFLPANLIMAVFSLGLSAKMVMHWGTLRPMAVGMACIAIGLLFFALAPASGSVMGYIMPGMLLMGLGAGMAFNPVLLAGMDGIPENEAGLVSGVLNTAFMMGGALGLAILASVAAFHTEKLLATGVSNTDALLGGYHMAFVLGAIFAAAAAGAAFLTRDVHSGSLAH